MIQLEHVSKRYGAIQALDDIDLTVRAGETFGIIGPNGAGKSTLLKILLGLVRPDRGRVRIDGIDLADDPIALRQRVGYVPQRDGFDDLATGRAGLRFLARLRGAEPQAIESAARDVGIDEQLDRPVGQLSGGQRQRLNLAGSLLGEPPVLLLDEPTASLDPRATVEFRGLIERLAAAGRTLLLCSHLLADVERLCGRVLVLLEGRVAAIEEVAPGQAGRASELEQRFLAAMGRVDAQTPARSRP